MSTRQKFLLLLLPFLLFQIVSAHPGRTASDGCHYCRSNCDSWGVAWNERHCDGVSAPAPSRSYVPVSEREATGVFSNLAGGAIGTADEAATRFVVVEVVDGDTLKVRDRDGSVETIRLIGIDTPETVHPSKPVECFGKEASARLRELVEGKAVTLAKDTIGDTIDRYGRYLRYIFLGNEDVNARMVLDGYAYAYIQYPFDFVTLYTEAEHQAREQGRGLWADGVCEDDERKAAGEIGTADGEGPTAVADPPVRQVSQAPTPDATSHGDEGGGGGGAFWLIGFLVAGVGWVWYRSWRT
jgi:micrococcal nuclease